MAYQYTNNGERDATPRRRRTTPSAEAPVRKRRRKKRNTVRIDLIVLAAVVLVVLLAVATPRQQVQVDPTDPPVVQNPTDPTEVLTDPPTEPPTDPPPTVFTPVPLTFTEEHVDLIYAREIYGTDANVEEAMLAELDWNLLESGSTVLIIHSHISESYTLGSDEKPNESSSYTSDPYRTDDERYNMVAIGKRVAEILEQHGIHVIHDTTSFEIPNSDYSYSNAKTHLKELLEENPDICLILDLHRDAVENSDGTQWAPTVIVNGEKAARISMVISQDNNNPRWYARNLSFAVKLGAQMNLNVENTFRQLLVTDTSSHYNQYLGPTTMLIEVGTAGNSMAEALNGAELLAMALVELAAGANLN